MELEYLKFVNYTIQRMRSSEFLEDILVDCFSHLGREIDVSKVLAITNHSRNNVIAQWNSDVLEQTEKLNHVNLTNLSEKQFQKLELGMVAYESDDSINNGIVFEELNDNEFEYRSLVYPIIVEKSLWGMLVLASQSYQKVWPDTELMVLNCFANAITNKVLELKKEANLKLKNSVDDNDKVEIRFIENALGSKNYKDLMSNLAHNVKEISMADGAFIYELNNDYFELVAENNNAQTYTPVTFFTKEKISVLKNYWHKVLSISVANTLEIFPIANGVEAQYISLEITTKTKNIVVILAWNEASIKFDPQLIDIIRKSCNLSLWFGEVVFFNQSPITKTSNKDRFNKLSKTFFLKNNYSIWHANYKTKRVQVMYEENEEVVTNNYSIDAFIKSGNLYSENNLGNVSGQMILKSGMDWNVFEGPQLTDLGKSELLRVSSLILERDENGLPIEMVGCSKNIGRESTQNLKDNFINYIFSDISEMASIGKWSYDFSQRVFYWSDQTMAMLDIDNCFSKFENSIKYFSDNAEAEKITEALIKVAAGFENFNFIFDRELKGQTKYFQIKGEADKNKDGSVSKLNGYIQDISDFKLETLKLEESKNKVSNKVTQFYSLFNEITAGVMIKKVKGFQPGQYPYFMCNPKAISIFNHQTESFIIGKTDDAITHFISLKDNFESDVFVIKNRSIHYGGVIELNDINGKVQKFDYYKVPLLSTDGDVESIAIVINDITDAEIFNDELRRKKNLETLSNITSSIGLEFNNLLHIVQSYCERLQQSLKLNEKNNMIMTSLLDNIELTKEQSEKLLAFNISDNFSLRKVNLCQFYNAITKVFEDKLKSYVKIRYNICQRIVRIEADQNMLNSIFSNISTLFKEYLDLGAKIELSLEIINQKDLKNRGCLTKSESCAIIRFKIEGIGSFRKHIDNLLNNGFTYDDINSLKLNEAYASILKQHGDINFYELTNDSSYVFDICFPLLEVKEIPEKLKIQSKDNLNLKFLSSNTSLILFGEMEQAYFNTLKSFFEKNKIDYAYKDQASNFINFYTENLDQIGVVLLDAEFFSDYDALKLLTEKSQHIQIIIIYDKLISNTLNDNIKKHKQVTLFEKPNKMKDLVNVIYQALKDGN